MVGSDLLKRALGAAAPPAAGTLRMAAAAAADVLDAIDVFNVADLELPDDPFAARDPNYIRATLPALGLVSETYFRGEVRGLDNIPVDGPVLLVGNHSGGTLIADSFVFGHAFYEHFGPQRQFHQLAHDMVFRVPGIRALLGRYGTVPASPENMRRAIGKDAALLVYPGGDHETYRPTWESSEIDFAGRTGFAKLALDLGVPIVPIVSIGGQETALFLGQGTRLARALQLNRLFRVKVFPAQIGPPAGLTILDLPIRVPLPAKITIRVLPSIDLREQLGSRADPGDAYELVTGRMQNALNRLDDERTLPVIG